MGFTGFFSTYPYESRDDVSIANGGPGASVVHDTGGLLHRFQSIGNGATGISGSGAGGRITNSAFLANVGCQASGSGGWTVEGSTAGHGTLCLFQSRYPNTGRSLAQTVPPKKRKKGKKKKNKGTTAPWPLQP